MTAALNSDRALRLLLLCVAVVTAITLAVGFFTAPYIIAGANNSDQVVKGNTLNACRSQIAAKVTDARTTVDEARTAYEVTLGQVAQQVIGKSDTTLALAALQSAAVNIATQTEALRQETAYYKDALTQSAEHPDLFLADHCRPSTQETNR